MLRIPIPARILVLFGLIAAAADGRLWPRAAEIASESLQPRLALDAARHWMKQDPGSIVARHIAARAALALFKIDQSADDYRFVVASGNGGIESGIGAIAPELREAASPYGARQVADRLASVFPASPAARQLQGIAALRGDDPAAAVHAFEAALAQTPPAPKRTAAARAQLRDLLRNSEYAPDAILQAHDANPIADQLFDELVKDMPGRAPCLLAARAGIYARAGDAARARKLLNAAIRNYPDSADLRYARASAEEDSGHVDVALRELKALLEARPSDPEAMNALGYTLAAHARRFGYARRLIEQALAVALPQATRARLRGDPRAVQ